MEGCRRARLRRCHACLLLIKQPSASLARLASPHLPLLPRRPPHAGRDTSPLLPATRALAAALSMLGPLAVLLMGAFALAESRGLYMVYTFSTGEIKMHSAADGACRGRFLCPNPAACPCRPCPHTARLVGSLCGVPMLLWPAAVALTAYPPFRDAHMPAAGEPAQAAPSDADAAAAAAPLLPGADEPETAAAQPVHEELKEEAAQEAPAAGAKKED